MLETFKTIIEQIDALPNEGESPAHAGTSAEASIASNAAQPGRRLPHGFIHLKLTTENVACIVYASFETAKCPHIGN